MNYEKAYKEALERAKQSLTYSDYPGFMRVDVIFPELCESEDERIRKAIHIYLDWLDGRKDYSPKGEYSIRDMISWLEKQGNKKQVTDFSNIKTWKFIVDVVLTKYNGIGQYLDSAITETIAKELLERFGNIEQRYVIEKQGEQKPFDYENANIPQKDFAPKAEPIFKVGDFVVYNNGNTYQVEEISDERYELINNFGDKLSVPKCWEKSLRHWTINDAKDCDVLANKNGAIFINADNTGEDRATLDCYCYLSIQGEFYIEEHKTGNWFYKTEIHPATKEQCELLFQKMKEAGYEWDAEKKELIKK